MRTCTSPALCPGLVQDVLGELDGIGKDVVLNEQHRVVPSLSGKSCIQICSHRRSELCGARVTSIDFLVDDMVAEVTHVPQATRCTAAFDVWRPHVGRILADDVGQGSFILVHLFLAFTGSELV